MTLVDPSASGPAVVAVVIAGDPPQDRWRAVLCGLAAQDHPNLVVVVVDTGSGDDDEFATGVHRHLPDARVRRIDEPTGTAAVANRVVAELSDEERRGYLLFCHDDAAPDPGAIAALVDAAVRWEADVVGPKLVAWDDPRQLLEVGRAADRLGATLPYVEQHEIDQAQHDGLHDVFSIPPGFVLVRTERFIEVGGFDEALELEADGLSLCWRARMAGTRVLVTTAASVRHAEDCSAPRGREVPADLDARERLRMMLAGYSVLGVIRALPLAAVMSLGEALGAFVSGRWGRARAAVMAWPWNVVRIRSLMRVRRTMRRCRRTSDKQIRTAQVRGVIGPRMRLRRLQRSPAAAAVAATADPSVPPTAFAVWTPASAAVALALTSVLLFGSRHLLTQGVPATGGFVPVAGTPADLVAGWATGWRDAGLGMEAAAPTLLAVLGVLGGVSGGALGFVRSLAILGLLPLGVVGAHRLAGPTGSKSAQIAAATAYAAVPLPYNALAAGRWSSLAAYAAAPWLLARLARASGIEPFGTPQPDGTAAGVAMPPLRRHVAATGAVTGLAGLLVPQAPALLIGLGIALVIGSLLAWQVRGIGRIAGVALGGAVLGALLHLPVTLEVIGSWAGVEMWAGGTRPPVRLGGLEALRFQVGDLGTQPLGYALVAAAALPLLIARSWRLAWAIRGWTVALAGWAFVWAGGRLDIASPHPDVVLAPAAAGLVLVIAVGVAAVGADVRGRTWRLGFRRLVATGGLVALVAAPLPVVVAALDGWWSMPRGDFARVLEPIDPTAGDAPARVLWLGHPDVLPGGEGWPLDDDLHYALSTEVSRTVADLWPGPERTAQDGLPSALDLAASGQTSRLGRLLAPYAIEYVVVPERGAPVSFAAPEQPVPDRLLTVLADQLDLERVEVDPSVVVYRNTAAPPLRSTLDSDTGIAVLATAEASDARSIDLSEATPALGSDTGVSLHDGAVDDGRVIVHAVGDGDHWRLDVTGRRVGRHDVFGWSSAYLVESGGAATLHFVTPLGHRLATVTQGALWLAVALVVLRMRVSVRPESGGRRWRRRTNAGEPTASADRQLTTAGRSSTDERAA